MARIFMTGFEAGNIGVVNDCVGSVDTAIKRTGEYSFKLDHHSEYGRAHLDGSPDEIYVRFAVYPDGISYYTYNYICKFFDAAPTEQISLCRNAVNHVLVLYRGRGATLLARGSTTINFGTWYCIEVYLKVSNAAGVCQVKVNGVLDINFSGDTQQTANAECSYFQWGRGIGGASGSEMLAHFDDIAINDTTGTKNNSWIGRGGIYGLKPSGAGTYAQFTPSTGANYECVDEVPPNDDTDYVESDTVGYKDSYALADLPVATGQVDAVQWLARAKLDAAGAGNFKRLLRHDSTDYNGENLTVDTSYVYHQEILENAPDDTEWTVAKVNALEIGMEIS